MTRSGSLLNGVSASATYGIAALATGILLIPIVIAQVGAAAYGVWLLLSTLSTYLYQADLGMGAAIVHFLSKFRGGSTELDPHATVSAGVVWMTVAGFAALPVYMLIGIVVIGSAEAETAVPGDARVALVALGSVLVACIGLRAFSATLQGSGYWVVERQTQMMGLGIRVAGTLIACFAFETVLAVAIAETIALLVPALASVVLVVRMRLVRLQRAHVTRARLRMLATYGVRAFVVGAMGAIILQSDIFIVGIVAPAAAVTYYAATLRVYAGVRQILGWLTEPILPTLSRQFAADPVQGREIVLVMQFASLGIATGAAITLSLVAPALVPVWLGDEAPSATLVAVLCILLGGLVLNATHIPAIPAADASGRPGAFLRLHAMWCILNVALSLALGSEFGLVGVALGTALPLLALEPLYLRRIHTVLGISPRTWAVRALAPVVRILLPALTLSAFVIGASVVLAAPAAATHLIGALVFAGAYSGSALIQLRRSGMGTELKTMFQVGV